MALVLDRHTGYVSPQFHVRFDNQFNSVTDNKYDSEWKLKTGLISINEKELKRRDRMPIIIPGYKPPQDNESYNKLDNKTFVFENQNQNSKNKKSTQFNDIKNYKPSGNLIYNNNLLDKLKI